MSKFFKNIKNKIASVFSNDTQPIKDIYNVFLNTTKVIDAEKYNTMFRPLNKYYNKQSHTTNPILFIAVISFNQKKGSIIEFTYPDKEVLLEKDEKSKQFFESLLDESDKTINTSEKVFDNIINQLTYLCMPDGAHTSTSDSTFFLIQNFKKLLFGISCYRQLKVTQAMKEDEQENTRDCVQKAMCIVSTLPLFGQMASKLSITMLAYFNQDSLKDKKIIEDLYLNYSSNYLNRIKVDEILESFSLKRLIYFTKDKIFSLIKLIMLEKKILVYSHVSNNICSFIFSFLSLFPGGAFFNLNNEGRAKMFYDCYTPYGLPLKFLNENSVLYSILTLYDVDKLEKKNIVSYFIGTTNPLLMNYGKIDFDCIINLDEDKIIIKHKQIEPNILDLGKKETSLMKKLYKECKNLFKNELYDDLNDNWMLDKNDNQNPVEQKLKKSQTTRKRSIYLLNSKEVSLLFTGSDDYIRNIFKKFITNFLADIHLAQYIVTSSNSTEEVKLQKIKDVLCDYNCDFIFNWITKTNNFLFWNYEHSHTLWRISPHLKKCKYAEKIYENGDVYEGELCFGEPNNNGKMDYCINGVPYIYIGEFLNGLKHGKGNLSTKESNNFNYDGDWAYDKYEGYGTLFNNGEKYIGNFIKGQKGGKGILYKKNGDIVEGEFENDKIMSGKIMFKNDDEYEGSFEDGKMSGKGVYKYKNGDKYEGYFENDLFNGEGILIKNDGEIIKGIFEDGELAEKKDDISIDIEPKNKSINHAKTTNIINDKKENEIKSVINIKKNDENINDIKNDENNIKKNDENINEINGIKNDENININEINDRENVENINENNDNDRKNDMSDDTLDIGNITMTSQNITITSPNETMNKDE